MKLLSLIPTPQHVVTADEVEKTDGRSFGRSSNTFWAALKEMSLVEVLSIVTASAT